MKLSTIVAVAAAGVLAGCVDETPETENSVATEHSADAVQRISKSHVVIEFTPQTSPEKQCVALVGTGAHSYAGGVTCWDKKSPSP